MADPSLPTHPSPASGAASSTSTSTTTPQTTKSMAATTDNKKAPTNPRGIPYAPFIEKVEDYIPQTSDRASQRQYVEATLKKFDEMIQKYQFMEANTSKRAEGLRDKIPEYKRTLETVRFLISRQEQKGDGDGDGLSEGGENGDDDDGAIETAFELNDTLYAKARVPVTDEVYIWLGVSSFPTFVFLRSPHVKQPVKFTHRD